DDLLPVAGEDGLAAVPAVRPGTAVAGIGGQRLPEHGPAEPSSPARSPAPAVSRPFSQPSALAASAARASTSADFSAASASRSPLPVSGPEVKRSGLGVADRFLSGLGAWPILLPALIAAV